MNRDELNSKIAEAMKDRATTWGGFVKWDELAEACLSAIEQSGCTICPNDEVSCNRPEQAENQGSASLPSGQSDYLREALRSKAYFSFYMDGRNEHGTHLLEAGGSNILNPETILEVIQDQHHELAEKIFKTAERLGHEAGHCIVTEWEWDDGGECSGYYGYGGLNTILTAALHGTPEEQRAVQSQIEEPRSGDTDPST